MGKLCHGSAHLWSGLLKTDIWKSWKHSYDCRHYMAMHGSLCLWRYEQGLYMCQKCSSHHEPTFFCSSLKKRAPKWLCPVELKIKRQSKKLTSVASVLIKQPSADINICTFLTLSSQLAPSYGVPCKVFEVKWRGRGGGMRAQSLVNDSHPTSLLKWCKFLKQNTLELVRRVAWLCILSASCPASWESNFWMFCHEQLKLASTWSEVKLADEGSLYPAVQTFCSCCLLLFFWGGGGEGIQLCFSSCFFQTWPTTFTACVHDQNFFISKDADIKV